MTSIPTLLAGLFLVIGSLFAPVAHPGLAADVSTNTGISAPIVPAAITPNPNSLLNVLQRSGYSAEQARSLCESNGGTATVTASEVSCKQIQNTFLICPMWNQAKTECENAGGRFNCDLKNVGCVM
jgi:hypothetical protein